jgi:hypothetical protein
VIEAGAIQNPDRTPIGNRNEPSARELAGCAAHGFWREAEEVRDIRAGYRHGNGVDDAGAAGLPLEQAEKGGDLADGIPSGQRDLLTLNFAELVRDLEKKLKLQVAILEERRLELIHGNAVQRHRRNRCVV